MPETIESSHFTVAEKTVPVSPNACLEDISSVTSYTSPETCSNDMSVTDLVFDSSLYSRSTFLGALTAYSPSV